MMTRKETLLAIDLLLSLADLVEKTDEGLVAHWRDGGETLPFSTLDEVREFVRVK